jgi:dTDP-4-amino-4,6-dideoxygalactose transaminase
MRIGRTLPPAAAPIYWRDIVSGLKGLLRGKAEFNRFESELKEYFGTKHCFLVSSGKAALTVILQALKEMHPDRDEVLIPAFACYSVPSAIVRAGLKVRLCDIDPNTLDFNFEELSKILSQDSLSKGAQLASSIQYPVSINRLLAIIPIHLFGLPADVERVRDIVHNAEVTIIEDAAQAMGGRWNGKRFGTLGDVSFFSLGRGKPFSTVEGGIIITDKIDIAERVAQRLPCLKNYSAFGLARSLFNAIFLATFLRPTLFWFPKTLPFLKLGETFYDPCFPMRKMTPFQAGLSRRWREKLEEFQAHRAENSLEWNSIPDTGFKTYHLPQEGNLASYIRYPVRFSDDRQRADLLEESDRVGLGIMPTYPDAINGIAELRETFHGQNFPEAKKVVRELVTLPVHPFLSQRDRHKIITLLSQIGNPKL